MVIIFCNRCGLWDSGRPYNIICYIVRIILLKTYVYSLQYGHWSLLHTDKRTFWSVNIVIRRVYFRCIIGFPYITYEFVYTYVHLEVKNYYVVVSEAMSRPVILSFDFDPLDLSTMY